MPGTPYTTKEAEEVLRQYRAGVPVKDIAAAVGRCTSSVVGLISRERQKRGDSVVPYRYSTQRRQSW